MTSKVFVELERIRRKCKVEELFLKSLFKKRGRRKITQHNHTHNITAISHSLSEARIPFDIG